MPTDNALGGGVIDFMKSKAVAQAEPKKDEPVCNGEQLKDLPPQTGKGPSEGLARGQAEMLFNTIRDLNAGFGEIVTLMLFDPQLRHLLLSGLEWLVAPPIAVNQVLTIRGNVKDKDGVESGLTVPLAFALWAKVSKEIGENWKHKRLGVFLCGLRRVDGAAATYPGLFGCPEPMR